MICCNHLLVRIVGLEPTRIFQQTLLRRSGLPIPPYPHVVASVGLEPTHPFGHQILSLACLPISPQGHVVCLSKLPVVFSNVTHFFRMRGL